ncbi:MAG: hypothetical protein CMM08_15995 [Rhodospirillaceae bacterium]|mgnify:CR=1 FL=1|jgi:hypothetical protein|nr:hypothetical protein [Rhodospirillaceae bacterium]|tara:strand:+ start:618 stop:947 length:330 start_codon:yes stop_codon:yes gene_type:complete
MYCRSAFFIGSVAPDNLEAFRSQIEGAVADAIMKFPGVRRLQVKWAREIEDGAPAIFLTLEHSYASQADLEHALASDARTGAWEALDVVKPYFRGEIVHINNEVREFGP